MPNSHFSTLLEKLSRALMFGPEMLLFFGVVVIWTVSLVVHLRSPRSRTITRVVLYSLAILCGLLGPLHDFCRDYDFARSVASTGQLLDPFEWSEFEQQTSLGSLLILAHSIAFLAISTWAWWLPGPTRRPSRG